jgi:Zn-dependent protease with chaperone function
MYLLLGISILLAAMLSFNSLASLLASFVWQLFGRHTRNWPAAVQASTLFLLRVAPAAVGLACLVFLIGPAYAEYEPRSTTEGVSYKLAFIAFASAAGIVLAIIRGFASWRATTRLTDDWLSHAQPIAVDGVKIRCYQIDHQFPVIALVGILRPRLFIASQIFEKLQPEEISGAIQHEIGHMRARDNLKRGLLRACRDVLLIFPCGRSLDRRWAEASESAADEHAAAKSRQVALDLASALVKIARMVPSGARPAMPAGVFLVGEESSGIRARVSRLVQLAGSERRVSRWEWLIPKSLVWLSLVSSVVFLIVFSRQNSILATVHSLIEHAVYFLD